MDDRGEVRGGVAAARDEGDVLAAEALDPAAAHHPVRVGAEDHREEHAGRVGWRAGGVVPEPCVDARQIHRVREQVVRGVLEGARQELGGQVDRQEARARVDVLVAGHGQGGNRGHGAARRPQPCRPAPWAPE